MKRVREGLNKGLPVATGALMGAMLATLLVGSAARAAAGVTSAQDPATQMQIQQIQNAMSNFQIQLQTQLNLMQSKIDTLERQQQNMRFQLDRRSAEGAPPVAPLPDDPIPGTRTWGRLVSTASESERFVLTAPRGDLLAQLAMTSDGPGLVLFDASGQISVALLATAQGPELRMVDADGILQTVLSGR